MNRFFLFALLAPLFAIPACSNDDPPTGAGIAPTPEAGPEDSGGGASTQCTAARDQALTPIGKVSAGAVTVVEEAGGVTTVYVDASAGGIDQALKNARIYVKLPATKVEVTDKTAPDSTEWDLALKRQVIFTNSGDASKGAGGGGRVNKAFDAVTAADADGATVAAEDFLDDDCQLLKDSVEVDPRTTFAEWYDYAEGSHGLTPKSGITFIVKGGQGGRYKVGIESYTGKPDGTTTSPAGGYYLLKVAAL